LRLTGRVPTFAARVGAAEGIMKSSLPMGKTIAIVSLINAVALGRMQLVHATTCDQFTAPVWSYTTPPGTELLFSGVTDPDGNLYWIEYRPGLGTQQVVSARRDGSIRYRAAFERTSGERELSGYAAWAEGFVLIAIDDHHVRAFDANTGELAWDTKVPGHDLGGQLTDTGAQVIVVLYGHELTGLDLASGQTLWTHPGEASVSTSSGDIFLTQRDAEGRTFLTRADSSGMNIWSEPACGYLAAVLRGEIPLVGSLVFGGGDIVVHKRWWELPSFDVVTGNDLGFMVTSTFYGEGQLKSFSAGDASTIGEQTLSRGAPYGFYGSPPLLTQEHLLLIWQETGPCPCLCHPTRFLQAKVSAWTKTAEQLFSCDLPNLGEASVGGVSLYSGSLVIGRHQYISTSCIQPTHADVIEAYEVPGEELAEDGWVVGWAGNPARTRRPVR